jgi:hypothetical protein
MKEEYLFPESGHPAAGADEIRVVQPYWSEKLKNFPDKEDLAVVLEDTHRSVSYGNRKPDVVGYVANKPRSVFHIALVGDVKARRQANKESFDASEKGHLESFLEDLLLDFQPYRRAANGFLTDGCLIQFFRLERLGPAELLWREGPVLHLHDMGDRWLLGLLQDTSVHELPADITIDKEPVVMGPLLGVGGSSVVYSGMHQGTNWASDFYLPSFFVLRSSFFSSGRPHAHWPRQTGAEVVVKRFNSTYKLYHLQQEAAILRKIESVVPRVPRLIARDDQGLVLLLQPVGVQFASRLSHFDPQKETVRVTPHPSFSSTLKHAADRTHTR